MTSVPARSATVPTARVAVDDWGCHPLARVVLRRTAMVEYFRRPDYPEDRYACLKGQRFAAVFSAPRDGTTNGTADLQFSGRFLTLQVYGSGCGSGSCKGPVALLLDLRGDRRRWQEFQGAVRIRANTAGNVALIVRDYENDGLDSGFPAGPGPFRVDIVDRLGRRTVGRGPGIVPGSLTVRGRSVTWLQDGTQRWATFEPAVAQRPARANAAAGRNDGLRRTVLVADDPSPSRGPRARRAATGYTQLSTGGEHVCALSAEGRAVCWGATDSGQGRVPAGSYTQISSGYDDACALTADGQGVCWGNDLFGQSRVPPGRYTQISAGAYHSCALTMARQGVCWGSNRDGQLRVPRGHYVQISAAFSHSCALTTGGRGVCWGSDRSGQSRVPPGRYTQISAGAYHSCALKASGTIVCWGSNRFGQLRVPQGRYAQISTGVFHSCALTASGKAVCWGRNISGEIAVPAARYTRVSAGGGASCALTGDGRVWCWGWRIPLWRFE